MKTIGLLNLAQKIFKANNNKSINSSDSKINETVINLFKNNKSRKSIYVPNIRIIRKLIFLIFDAKKIFNYLQLAFIKVSIF